MLTSRKVGRMLVILLTGSALTVVAAFLFGGWLTPNVEAQCCQTFCQMHPTAPNCTPPMLPRMTKEEKTLFSNSLQLFFGTWFPLQGLGPVFTSSACVNCHATPFAGGAGTVQVTHFGKLNSDGSFNPLTNEGGDELQPGSIADAVEATACEVPGEVIPSDATIIAHRQTPPTLGNGLMDSIPDTTIQANATNQMKSHFDQMLGIHGQSNMVPDLKGVLRPGRFGWKAQQPTLLQFVAAAFQHELGITNPINQNEDLPQGQPIPSNCQVASTNPNDSDGHETVHMSHFEFFIAPHTAAAPTPTTQHGFAVFQKIGCAECHVPSMKTAAQVFIPLSLTSSGQIGSTSPHPSPSLSSQTAHLYSDLLIHDMGAGLADGIPQGQASGSQWRTTPLWGLSLKTLYLHDGRTADLSMAILAHSGEAAKVTQNFQGLTAKDSQDLLAFLNSL